MHNSMFVNINYVICYGSDIAFELEWRCTSTLNFRDNPASQLQFNTLFEMRLIFKFRYEGQDHYRVRVAGILELGDDRNMWVGCDV
jgi:hypothetical protein